VTADPADVQIKTALSVDGELHAAVKVTGLPVKLVMATRAAPSPREPEFNVGIHFVTAPANDRFVAPKSAAAPQSAANVARYRVCDMVLARPAVGCGR
jgi:hypothetical protein